MTVKKDEHTRLIIGSLVTLALLAIAMVLHITRAIMIPFVLAIFIATLVSPLLDVLVLKCKWPRIVAYLVTLLVVLAVLTVICLLVAQAIQMIVTTSSKYSDSFSKFAGQIFAQVKQWGIEINQQELITSLSKKVPRVVTNTFGTLLGFFSSFFLTTIFILFLLAGRNPHLVHRGIFAEIDGKIRQYVLTKVVVSTITGLLVWLILALFKLELAAVFGILALLLNFIPSVGSIIATLLPLPVAIAQFSNPWMIALVIFIPGSLQMAIGNIIEPRIMGKGLNLHPVTIILALSFWGLIWGIVGMFLAAPLTAILRIVFMQFDTLKPLGYLMGGEIFGTEKHDEDKP